MAQRLKVLAAKHDNLNQMSRTHKIGENHPHNLSDFCMSTHIYANN